MASTSARDSLGHRSGQNHALQPSLTDSQDAVSRICSTGRLWRRQSADIERPGVVRPACAEWASVQRATTSSTVSEDADVTVENCAHVCVECGKCFPSLARLEAHMKDHSARLFTCHVCEMSFTRSEYLKVHARTHTGARPYICKECGAAFAASTNLSKHKRIHSGDRRFKCQFCGRAFVQSGHLKKHINSQHKDGQVLLEALSSGQHNTCSGDSSDIMASASSKPPMGPHVCTECGTKFARAKNLKIHQLKHSGVKGFACSECGQAFAVATYLREHQRTHSAARPFTCSVCCLGFKASTNLYKHMRVHTGEKRFACQECGQAFSQSGNLKKHMSRHTTTTSPSSAPCARQPSTGTTA